MFLKMNNPLKYLDEVRMKKKSYVASYAVPSSKSSSGLAIGLRIVLIQRSQTCQSNVVVKSTLKLSQPTSKRLTLQPTSLESCYLKSCHLCKRKLRPDKDIYMYRGDQGFCSVMCRSTQMVMDEKKELETSTKHMLASIRHRGTTGRCETRGPLQEDYRRQHRPPPRLQRNRAIFL